MYCYQGTGSQGSYYVYGVPFNYASLDYKTCSAVLFSPSDYTAFLNLSVADSQIQAQINSVSSRTASLESSVSLLNSQYKTMSDNYLSIYQSINQPFDVTVAMMAFAFFFSSVLFFFQLSKAAGIILDRIRKV